MFAQIPAQPTIPQQQIDAIWNKIGEVMARIIGAKPPPKLIYHYTDAEGLCGIIGNGILRATHISYMNDVREYWHAIALFREEAALIKPTNQLQSDLLDLFGKLKDNADPFFMPPLFVACFSANADSVSLWRAYGRGEGGYAIGFDREAIGNALKLEGRLAWLTPVVYNKNEQGNFVRLLLDWTLSEYPRWAAELPTDQRRSHLEHWIESFFIIASFLAPVLKDPAFEEEHEWRIVDWPKDRAEIHIGTKPALSLSARVDLSLGTEPLPQANVPANARNFAPPKILPIKELRVGPGQYVRLAHTAAHMLLLNAFYDGVEVKESSVPFRAT